jgi:hypothetical protein
MVKCGFGLREKQKGGAEFFWKRRKNRAKQSPWRLLYMSYMNYNMENAK